MLLLNVRNILKLCVGECIETSSLSKNRIPAGTFLVLITVVVVMRGFILVMNALIAIKKIFFLIFTQQVIIKEQK